MKFLIFACLILTAPTVFGQWICEASCLNVQTHKYNTHGNKGMSYDKLLAKKHFRATGSKSKAWKNLKNKCAGFLLVSSYKAENDMLFGKILKKYNVAKKRNVCRKINEPSNNVKAPTDSQLRLSPKVIPDSSR